MVTVASAPAAVETRRWRITIDRDDAVVALRDYFRRLGLSSEVDGSTAVRLETDESADDVGTWLASWANVNGIPAQLDPIGLPLPLLLPVPPSTAAPRLGELLIRKGFITEEQLAWALGEARATNELLGIVLLSAQMIFEDELARTLSEQLSIPYISIRGIGVNRQVARLLPADVGMAAAAIPVRANERAVQVVFADPTDPRALAAVREFLPTMEVAVAELSDIRSAWREITQTAHTGARGQTHRV
jgi:hypothetical protein